jgi:hypothetical protein
MPYIDVLAQNALLDLFHLIDLNIALAQEEGHARERWKHLAAARHTVRKGAKFINDHPEDPARILERAFWTADEPGCPCAQCAAYDRYRASTAWSAMSELIKFIKTEPETGWPAYETPPAQHVHVEESKHQPRWETKPNEVVMQDKPERD